MKNADVVVIGAGIFGITTALTLQERGYRVALCDPGPIPHPLAASTDISKVVRGDYGIDEAYTQLFEEARAGWHEWNETLFSRPLYHEVGMLFLTSYSLEEDTFEGNSWRMMQKREYPVQRLFAEDIGHHFPTWAQCDFKTGYFNPWAGYAESGAVVTTLLEVVQKTAGITLYPETKIASLIYEGGKVAGIKIGEGESLSTAQVVVAAGAWTPLLVPEIAPFMRITGHPVFHREPEDTTPFMSPHFPVFAADITQTGWYGFPLHAQQNVVKLGHHGLGQVIHPEKDERKVVAEDAQRLQQFLAKQLPALQSAPTIYTRLCLYADTLDEHFWIAPHPEVSGLTVATGGSGHGFKFAPVLGGLVADAVEGKRNPYTQKFAWRHLGADTDGEEAARSHIA